VLAAVKHAVDHDPTPGQFVLTGSVRAELGNETWLDPSFENHSRHPQRCGRPPVGV
jgi:hypothetical protein